MNAVGPPPPLVTVLMPTHDHASTIGLALDSVLAQTVSDLAVVVIGDGATPAVADQLTAYAGNDRVRAIYRPKSESRSEEVRHEVLLGARSEFVAYLGDDDLMLPDHLAQMLELIADADFVHPLPVYIDRGGEMRWHATDLSQLECRRWHEHPGHNCVSLSGVVHRLSAYRRLPFGWRAPPPQSWSDHYMWQQWFATPGLRYRTGTRPTILKFDASLRQDLGAEDRRAELLEWSRRSKRPEFADELERAATEALREFGIRMQLEVARLRDSLEETSIAAARLPQLKNLVAELRDQLEEVRVERDDALRQLDLITAARTWRLHDWAAGLRPVRALMRPRRTDDGDSQRA